MRTATVLILALVVALAGCGGGTESGDAGGEAASIVPAGAALYISGNTDFEGDEWEAAEELVRRFPDGERAIQMLLEDLQAEDVDFEADVKPALGPEVALVVLELDSAEPAFVGLTQPRDEQKLQDLLSKSDEPTVSEVVDGWTVFSDDQAAIDEFQAALGGDTLADSEDFQETMEGLEGGLVSVYANGDGLQSAAEHQPDLSQGDLGACFPEGRFPSFGAVVHAEDGGARLDGNAVFAGDLEEAGLAPSPYEAELLDDVPSGVLAYVSFSDLESQLSYLRDCFSQLQPEFESQLGQAEGFLGLSLEEDLAPLFAGESALYVRGGSLIPEVTLLTEVEDEEQAVATLDEVVESLRGLAPIPLPEPQTTEIAGVQVRQLEIQPPVSLYYGAFDGKLVVTSAREGIADLREDGDRFADEDGFATAKDRSGLPDETTGWAYVDLAEVFPLLLGFAGGVPPEVQGNIDPLRSVVVYSTTDGARASFSLFVGIE
ncbi:MAG TPA: DUF3352 domain-containing protein [Gaiellaceae bacterium]|nr:DUF3352 domain-containing protein [Gaiellaceae bacterium]